MKNYNKSLFPFVFILSFVTLIAAACSDSSSGKKGNSETKAVQDPKLKDDSNTKTVQEPKLEDVDAEQIQNVIDTYKNNKAVLVNVWATWCVPCVEEFPEIVEIQRKYPRELQVVFISADFPEDRERAEKFLKKHNVDWTTYFKADKDEPFINALSEDWSGALPFTKIISTNGMEIAHWENKADFDTFNKHVKQAIKP